MKRWSKSYVIMKLQIKQQKDITIYLLEWPESKILKKPNASKNIK